MKARFQRALALLLVLVLTLGCIPAVSAVQPNEPVTNPEPAEEAARLPEGSDLGAILQGNKDAELEALQPETPKDTDPVRVIVELDVPALTEQSGMFAGKALTDAGRTAQQNVIAAQEQVEAKIAEAAPEASVRYSYSLLLNGIALECAYGHIAELEALPGVKAVHLVQTYELPTEPKVTSGGGMIGAPTAWNLGMDGSGMVVAVLDTGLDTDHAAFAVDPKSPAVVRGDIDEILSAGTLQAQRLVRDLSSSSVYLSGKVPYVFDYADHDTDVNHHGGSDHGTHVAGIVAANPADGSVTGVAPQAQLMILKVFPDGSTGANSDDILAALEDCVTLGVDVVNLSLGSPAGFTYRSDLLSTMEVYDRLAKAGIIVAAAAGNEYSAAYKNLWGTDLSLTSNPDYGIVGSPSSYSQTLSVASADNVTVRSAYFEAAGRKITFTDTATTNNPEGGFIRVLGGKTLDYVVVPGNGEEADYANLNVKGKVALVSRGVTTFAEKHEMAHVKGAAACIVYNTEAGMINMSIDSFPIPAIFISQADGQAMVAAAKDGVGTLTVSNSTYDAPSETGGQPSSFSSWGSTSQLEITPDIMAPGGNIYSSRDNNSYGLMSGTSMATPHLAGASALMLEYLRTAGIEGDAMTLAYALMMSTAVPAKGSNGVTASPRKQGAGLVNLASAMATKAYLQVEGKERPKLELGDDPDKTGEYQMTFRVVNFGTEPLQYAITPTVLTENAETKGDYGNVQVYFATQTSRDITAQTTWTTNCANNVVTVPAKGSADVTVTVKLSDALRKELTDTFENGIYIEGYITLKQQATAEGVTGCDLSIPYLAFYGDWDQAPVIDIGYYWQKLQGEPNWASQYLNYGGSMLSGTGSFYVFGGNPYAPELAYYPEHNTLSPLRTDGYYDKVDLIYTALLRNAKSLTYRITDAKTGETYYRKTVDYVGKSVYNANYDTILPAGSFTSTAIDPWYGVDSAGEMLKDDTTVIVSIDAELDHDGFTAAQNKNAHWEFPVTIDNTPPQILSSTSDGETLTLEVADSRYLAYVEVYDVEHMNVFSEPVFSQGYSSKTPGETATVRVNVSGLNKVYVCLADYGRNEKVVTLDAKTGKLIESSQFEYFENNGEITITGYTGSELDVVIPDEIGGYPVTAIAEKAFQLNKTVRSFTIGSKIRSIGSCAFARCASLTNIYVDRANPYYQSIDGVLYSGDGKTLLSYPTAKAYSSYPVASGTETIGEYAFFHSKVQTVFLPDTVSTIGDYAFYYAGELSSINFPTALTSIGDSAFFACQSLTAVDIPATITQIGPSAWAACTSLPAITVAAENPNYTAVDGVLYTKDMTVLKVYPFAKSGVTFTVPDSVVELEAYAFAYTGMQSIDGCASLRAIGDSAFYSCTALKSLPDAPKLETIGERAFYSCKALTSLSFPDSMRSIGEYAFAWCTAVKTFDSGNGLQETGKYSVYYCTALTTVRLGSGMKTIGEYAFYKCSRLANVDFGTSVREIGSCAFGGCSKITEIVLPDSVELVESAAFNSCSTAKTLVLSQNLREIGARAFMGLKGISTLTIPDSVQKIGNSAFNGLSNLLELHLSAKTQEYGSGVFSSASKLPRVELPEGMTAIPEEMFSSCNALTEVVIPSTVTRIEKGAFRSCKKLGNTELPAGLTYIGESAFYYAAMTSVTLPAGVTEIGERSFYNISALTEFNFSESLKTIGDFAFYGCGKLTRIVLPDSVESIGTSAFNRCSSLQEVVFGKGLASIGSMCFNYCHKLERFVVDETNPNFKSVDGVLYNKNVDTLVLYPQGRPDASFTMPETVKHIGPYGIYEPQLLQAVTVSPILETIDEFGMAGIALTGVLKLPATITSIHFKAFQYDDGVTAFELPESCAAYTTVDGVLYDKAVTHLLVYPAGRPDVSYETPDTVRTVGSYAFHSCKYLENIRLTGVEKLEERAFSTAKALKHIDLANSVQLIDTYACANLSTLTYLTGTGALRAIGANAFSSTGLEFVTLPANELLGQYAFSFCKDMSAVIGSTVQSIYASAFNYCKGMHEAYFLGDRPDSVGANIFAKTASDFTIYYDAAKAATWAPSGEIKWGEYPIAPATFHTVRFLDVDHSVLLEQPVAEGHAAMLPPEPQREEAAFTGWSADTSNVQQDMDVLALYDGLTDKLTVNVIAGENGTVDPLGETACFYDGELKLTIQPNEGYHTDRVLVNGEITACEDNTLTLEHIRSNTTVTVLFARNTYTVSLADGLTGNVFAALPVEYGEDAVLPEATPWHEGYHFTGWSADGRNITADCTITANYEQNSYTVRFVDYDGTELSVQTVLHGEAAELPASPAREGYTFVGWSGDVSAVTGDMTVTALYAVKTCTVFFTDWDGTVLKTQEVSYGEDAEAPQAPSREGYTFTGWSGDYTNITESRILMAQYERLSFTVRFVDYDGTELSSQSVFWGEAAAAPEAPAREGYTFTGWDADFSNIRKDLTVTAQYRFVLSFADVSETDWFCEDVRWAVENGIFQGVGNGLFAPEQALTRGQLVTVLYRMVGSPEPKAEANFRDVAADSYYAKAVAWANENGIVLGMGDGTFDPDSAVTREQMVTIFFRYAKFCGVKTEAGTLDAFRDAASVSDYAREAMGWAVKAGLVKGDGQDLMPKATASRAQAAAILHRFAAVVEK
ncbi:MAG: leucine-rich repeat protein [Oscillospiraceae bacterium]